MSHRTTINGSAAFFATVCMWALPLAAQSVRIATYNTSMNLCLPGGVGCQAGGLVDLLSSTDSAQPRQVAEQLQRVRPEILLLNEFNYDAEGTAAELFQQNFLSVPQNISQSAAAAAPIEYPYRYFAPVNTGVASGFDLDNNGSVAATPGTADYAGDAFGFGEFEGRYGMLVLSMYPIASESVRTFQDFLWRDMPDALLPTDWYSEDEQASLRLSSKSHWDVPIDVDGHTIHLLASHPTPPVFDGVEDRNGRRNHDEIRLWADYITPGSGDYLVDDNGGSGGLAENASFVVVGDLNSDPEKGDGIDGSIEQLLENPRVNNSFVPSTPRGITDTATFNLRADYVLPSSNITILDGQIFEPQRPDPLARLNRASDHRMVWLDVAIVPEPATHCLLLTSLLLLPLVRPRSGRRWR